MAGGIDLLGLAVGSGLGFASGVLVQEYRLRREQMVDAAASTDEWYDAVARATKRAIQLGGSGQRQQKELREVARDLKELAATPPDDADEELVALLIGTASSCDRVEQLVTTAEWTTDPAARADHGTFDDYLEATHPEVYRQYRDAVSTLDDRARALFDAVGP